MILCGRYFINGQVELYERLREGGIMVGGKVVKKKVEQIFGGGVEEEG